MKIDNSSNSSNWRLVITRASEQKNENTLTYWVAGVSYIIEINKAEHAVQSNAAFKGCIVMLSNAEQF